MSKKNDPNNPETAIETVASEDGGTPENPLEIKEDFSRFRLSQNFGSVCGVRKKLTTVPVRKPHKTQFVRVCPKGKLDAMLLEYPEKSGDRYLIEPDVMQEVEDLAKPSRLVQAIDRQNNVFIWPLTIPSQDRPNSWHLSAMEVAISAEISWTRMHSNPSLGAYEIFYAEGNLDEPEWPELSMNELLEIAFKNKIIDRPDHLVLRLLRGAE